MKTNRRNFLRNTGLASFSFVGMGMLSSCTTNKLTGEIRSDNNWQVNPEWQKSKYGEWGGPGVDPRPGPMDSILLKDYAPKSSVIVPKTFVPKPRYPVIDVHVHNYPERNADNSSDLLAKWVRTMDEVGVESSVLLTGATGEEFDRLVQKYLKPYPNRFQLYCGMQKKGIDKPDYPARAVKELERCYEQGARGVGELTNKGLGVTRDPELRREERMHHDDPRLDLFWEKCAELNMPVNMHIADHPSAWEPLDVFQERTPRTARKFLTKYQDRVLFGTDMGMEKSMYQAWWRLLESDDEYMVGRVWWQYYGLELSDSVLKSLYRDNAKRIMNWEAV